MSKNSINTINDSLIISLKNKYGSPLYIFDECSFIENYMSLKNSFLKYYDKYNIAYSYKTNYMPYICKLVLSMGGLAEVVSDFEYYVAKKVGYNNSDIIYNGPYKQELLEEHINNNGIINIDNFEECERIISVAKKNNEKKYSVGIRVNIDIGQSFISRFGMDPQEEDFHKALDLLKNQDNISLVGLHCHVGQSRSLINWKNRTVKMLELADLLFPNDPPKYIDLGSGMFGDMEEELKNQFETDVPSYDSYAFEIASRFNDHYKGLSYNKKPFLFTEPGATSASRYMWLISTVISHKKVNGLDITGLDCSFFNAGETSRYKKLPIRAIGNCNDFNGGNLVGYTCLEDDVLFPQYKNMLSIGDTILFGNTGGYSIVFKPPFILPDIPVLVLKSDNKVELIKHRQSYDDMLKNFVL